ncbi:MAG: ATP-grasp domain-containing protein, partial [Ornithinimicrobium sp.]
MDLFEYQARDMFEAHGVPVLPAEVITDAGSAADVAQRIGSGSGGVVVVKAQVKTGGRGKAGGVKLAKSAEEAQGAASDI